MLTVERTSYRGADAVVMSLDLRPNTQLWNQQVPRT